MKFYFHLRSGKTVTIDFPNSNKISELRSQDKQMEGADGIAFIEDVEAITVHAEPAEPRTLIDVENDTWTEVSPNVWLCRGIDEPYTLARIRRTFGPLKQEPR